MASPRKPRRRLTTEEKAHRTAKMKTKKLLAANPLLAAELVPGGSLAHWLPTPEGEQARIERIADAWTERQLRMRDLHEAQSGTAMDLRELVAVRATAAELAQLDERRTRLPTSPAYACEFWYARLREIDQAAAAARCENDHTDMARWHERCPRCWTPLQRPMRRAAPRQLTLAEVLP